MESNSKNRKFETDTFSLLIPSVYTDMQVVWESIRAAHELPDDDYLSYATTTLIPVEFFNEFDGENIVLRFWQSNKLADEEIELIEEKEIQVAGHSSNIRLVKSKDDIFYYLAIVQISDQFCYIFKGDCKIEHRAFYEPLFEAIWQSLEYFGNHQEAIDKLPKFLQDFYYHRKSENNFNEEEQLEENSILPFIEEFSIPVDDKEYWIIDDIQLQFLPECSASVNGTLYVNLEGIIPEFEEKKHSYIVDSYNGAVALNFSLSQIYNQGIPTGLVPFEKGRDESYNHYLWDRGFKYSLGFTGNVTLKEGWIGLNGYLEDKWDPKRYKISLAKKIATQELEWEKYDFTMFKELEKTLPKIVRQLKLKDPDPTELREELHSLVHLESLTIQFSNNSKEAEAFTEIPSSIKHFKNLKSLHLWGIAAITKFPEWIGDLRELEFLLLTGSKVEGIHPYTLQYLSKLKLCFLENNNLGSAPKLLPDNLEVLHLEGNQLTDVPNSYTQLKNLRKLHIKNNPLKSLPSGLENIPELDLELEKKMTLLDYTYKGADNNGVVPYEDELFYARNDSDLNSNLRKAIEEKGFQEYENGLSKIARHAVNFATTIPDLYDEVGNNRIGGLPDLPVNVDYPTVKSDDEKKGYQFIAQINCASIANLQNYLPRTGMLYFFIEDQQDFVPRVIFYEGETDNLKSAKELNIDEEFIYDESGIYQAFKTNSEKCISLPSFYNDEHYYKDIAPELKELEEKYDETEALKEALLPFNTKSSHGINNYVFKQHDSPEIEAVNTLKGKQEEWMVLLRVSSDNNPGFCFWDAGEIYFVIHKSDLAKKDFSNVYCGLETS
ncbi:DUF1963 domain-containing protein [Flavobacterium panacagri]|uniref:DUF1963 domain-containing protein n=1 Tax=Flavobacterium panacagri TaxID=3034146 RepID=UPI0025A4F116|nr:DUF1963 domain-containing protein [Flavobacterium panacagri]